MISLYTLDSSPDIHSKGLEFEKDPFSILVDKICEFFKGIWETLVALCSFEKKGAPSVMSTESSTENETEDVISVVFEEVQTKVSQEIKNVDPDFNLTRMIKQGNHFEVEEQVFQRSNQQYTEDSQYDTEVEKIKKELKAKVTTTFSDPGLQKAVLTTFSRDLFLEDHEERVKALLATTPYLKSENILQPYDDENQIMDAKSGISTHILSDKRVYVKKQGEEALVEIRRKFYIQDQDLQNTGRSIEINQIFSLDQKGKVFNLGIGSRFF